MPHNLTGVGIGRGVAVGPVFRMPDALPEPADQPSTRSVEEERTRATDSLAATAAQIRARGERAGGSAKDVLDAQAFMAEDPTLIDEITSRLDAGATAERAVFESFAGFRDMLVGMGGYMAERASDLDDVSQRVVAHLGGVAAPGVPDPGHPFILLAKDLAPADTALLDLDVVLALVTSEGGPTSHTAILAREKGIVAVVGVAGALDVTDGQIVVADAASGTVEVDPSESDQEDARARIEALAAEAVLPIGPGRLADGTPIPLLANLGSSDGAEQAVALGAEGVGLFRTEFLFLGAQEAPSVDEQQDHYRRLLAAFPGQKVVVRALDAGADKPLAFLTSDHEENPALGLRGLRALRAQEHVLRDQLTALARADSETDAHLWVMAPMVSTVEEARYFGRVARECGLNTVGVMVEVPASALLADRILAVTDFASIGTNDLTQYTLAADRLLGSVASFQDPWHPAVLRLIAEVGSAGAELAKPVGICGEAAADPMLAVVLVGLGATSLSMSPSALAGVRQELARHTADDARRFAELALEANSAGEARAAVIAAAESSPSMSPPDHPAAQHPAPSAAESPARQLTATTSENGATS